MMTKRVVCLLIILSTGLCFAQNPYWTGDGTGNLWSNTDNWTVAPVDGTSPHLRSDWGMDDPPVFDASAGDRTYDNLPVGIAGGTIPLGTTTLTVTGGSITTTSAFGLGWGGGAGNMGILYMTGGQVNADTFRMGVFGASGTAYISGGQVNTDELMFSSAESYLYLSGNAVFTADTITGFTDKPEHLIEITDQAQLITNYETFPGGNTVSWLQELIDLGRITGSDEGAYLAVVHNTDDNTVTVRLGEHSFANVLDWGAVGDGITDDTAAIKNCLDANTHVYFPPGTYKTTAEIHVQANRTLYGVENSPRSAVLKLHGDYRAFILRDNSTIRDLTLKRIHPDNNNFGILLSGSNMLVERVHILNNRSNVAAIMAHTRNNVHVRECYIENYTRWWDDGRGIGYGVFGVGIRFRLCVDSSIKDNIIVDYQDWPLPNNWQSGAIEVSDSVDSIVSGNYIYQSGDGAIDAGGATNISIVNNRIDNVYIAAIKLVNQTSGCVVSGNEISRVGLAGIWLTPGGPGPAKGAVRNNIISDNSIRNIGYGVGQGQWLNPLVPFRPTAILLDGDPFSIDYVTRDNAIIDNKVFSSPAMNGTWVEDKVQMYDPYNNVFSGNITLDRANVDGLGRVDLNDFMILARSWQSQVGDENWNFSADISIPPDGKIGLADLARFLSVWLVQ